MSKHTKLPWKATRHAGTEKGPFWGIWSGDERLAVLDAAGPIDEANARLIAAAPDLLAACESVFSSTVIVLALHGATYSERKEIEAAVVAARAAIAKAKAGA